MSAALAAAAAGVNPLAADPVSGTQERFTPRFGLVTVRAGGSACAFGGFIANQAQGLVECLDTATGDWKRTSDMPTARGLLAAAEVDGLVYALGGTRTGPDKLGGVERYVPETAEWGHVADLPTPRNALSAVAVGGAIYVVGGWGVGDDDRARDFDTLEIYDTDQDRWRRGAALPTARSHMAATALNGKIYTIGGWIQRAGSFVALDEVEAYDPETDEWSTLTALPTGRWLATAVPIDGRIYVVGGWTVREDGQRRATSIVEIFDPTTGRWHRDRPLPRPRAGHASVLVNGRVLLVGGTSDSNPENLTPELDWYLPSDFAETETVSGGERQPRSAASSRAELRDGGAWGRIMEVEQPFGNLHTNLALEDLSRLGLVLGSRLTVRIGDDEFSATLGKDFSDVARGEWVAFAAADGTMTLARNFANAAEACDCEAGAEVLISGN